MRCILTWIMILAVHPAFTQPRLPGFLQGTWKAEGKEMYEYWDQLNDTNMRGFSYEIKEGQMKVSEYLDISQHADEIIYTAAVVNQNRGKGIEFKLVHNDSSVIFENPDHDFPKRIIYKKLNDREIEVHVDGGAKGFVYRMKKQDVHAIQTDSASFNPRYDKTLAEKLGADDYGMKNYIFVILKTGANNATDKQLISESFRGHMANINRLVDEGKLVVAGPFGKNDHNYRGLFILNNVITKEAANELLQSDPAIKNGLLDFELFNWYGSAALPEYLHTAGKIWKLNP